MPYSAKTTVVLGADGFIGKNLVEYWTRQGWPVHGVGRDAGDFTDPQTVLSAFEKMPKADRIFLAITKQRIGSIQYDLQGELLRDNSRIYLNVLEAWRLHQPQAKLISLGSSCVYPESDAPIPETAFRSGAPHPSVRGYGLAKEILAVGCETYASQYGMPWLHCILATVYGPHAHVEEHRAHFMAGLIARAAQTKAAGHSQLEVWGNLETVRDLLFVEDQIEAIIQADQAFTDTIVNVSANAPVTIRQCVEAILDALEWDAEIYQPPGSFQGAGYKTIDAHRFLSATNWAPKVSLPEGIRKSLATLK